MVDAPLKRDFTVVGQRQISSDGLNELIEVLRFESRRGTSSEINRMDGFIFLGGKVAPKLQFFN